MDFRESLSHLPNLAATQAPQAKEHLVLDSMSSAEGLEQLVVICVGLDAPIQSCAVDLETRAQLYKGLTRAQMLALVVNERVEGGWLEFLSVVQFQEAKFEARRVSLAQKGAAIVHKDAVDSTRQAKQPEAPEAPEALADTAAEPEHVEHTEHADNPGTSEDGWLNPKASSVLFCWQVQGP